MGLLGQRSSLQCNECIQGDIILVKMVMNYVHMCILNTCT